MEVLSGHSSPLVTIGRETGSLQQASKQDLSFQRALGLPERHASVNKRGGRAIEDDSWCLLSLYMHARMLIHAKTHMHACIPRTHGNERKKNGLRSAHSSAPHSLMLPCKGSWIPPQAHLHQKPRLTSPMWLQERLRLMSVVFTGSTWDRSVAVGSDSSLPPR